VAVQHIDVVEAPVGVATARRTGSRYVRYAKPAVDRLAGLALFLLTLPVLLACMVAIRATMGRRVFFIQPRVGRDGRVFNVYKLRTMGPDRRLSVAPIGHDCRRVNHKDPGDPRHTRVGRFLRKWSLDELPQLWNVVRGDMSLVGPRPELPAIVAKYEPWQHGRHDVKPGLTGLWQISARGDKPMHECVAIDLEYVERISFALDCKILLRTPLAAIGAQRGF
jgi:lipopolysaccharide/colanic/teichoic acid biosynthesis glycosyltransferase